jgi:hypothetical protein
MPRNESPNHKDNANVTQSAIHGIRGTLFLLSIVRDEDDAANLRTDLKRSRLNECKFQRCTSLDQGCSMLRACAFDVVFLNLEELEEPDRAVEQIRDCGCTSPILGLVSRRTLDMPEYNRPIGIDDTLCKEDLSHSLVEHTVRSTLARHALSSERSLLETRLNLALEIGEMGSWTYYPKQRRFELDEIAQAMLQSATGLDARSLDEVADCVYPDDRDQFAEAIERLPLPNEIVKCQFRVNGDSMPLKTFEMRGRIWQPSPADDAAIMGLFRQASKTNELFERIAEANTAVQEAFQAREEAVQRANQKLQALATELCHTERVVTKSVSEKPSPKVDPNAESSTTQTPEPIEGPKSVEEIATAEPIETAEEPAVAKRTKTLEEVATVETVEQPEPEPPQAEEVKEAPKLSKKTSEALSIDKLSAYEEVMKSVARQKTATSTQESLPFDFAQEPVTDFSPPNPAKEGFISAAKRLVAMTRKEHNLEASISVADQQSIELERRKDMLFDILRELLINVVRHSQAKLCIITLFRDEDEWVLQVEDDGVGLDDKLKSVNAPLNKIGLFQIRTQLALKGGHLDIVPASPTGLIARVRIPVSIRDGAKSS